MTVSKKYKKRRYLKGGRKSRKYKKSKNCKQCKKCQNRKLQKLIILEGFSQNGLHH